MAKYVKGGTKAPQRGFGSIAAHLPPKIPLLPTFGSSSLDLVPSLYGHQDILSSSGSQRQHQRTPSCSVLYQEQPSWLDDLLDDSEAVSKKGSHRRCASDSFTYLENSGGLYTISDIAEEEELDHSSGNALSSHELSSLDHLDGDQLSVLLEEIQQLQKEQNLPVGFRTQVESLKVENSLKNKHEALSTMLDNCSLSNFTSRFKGSLEGFPGQFVCRPECESFEDEDFPSQHGIAGELMGPLDANFDSKRAKRHSAQRSRVRKLQYIAELERNVKALQTELSMVSPQVVYLERQQALLNMDNRALKQQIAIFMQDKKYKDSQNEVLKKEVHRLRNLYEFQLLHQEQKQKQQSQVHPLKHHTSLPSDFDIQILESNQFNLGSQQARSDASFSDSLTGLMNKFAGVSLGAGCG